MGFVGNANYFEMLDFALGFAGIDLCGDDGALLGHWPGQSPQEADDAAWEFEDIRRQLMPQAPAERQ
ncbi:MAG: hypothetical protein FJ291_19190 [Planctomycetes bacterium]|nr:hypothetical protein [Planctomycetota bacterium]